MLSANQTMRYLARAVGMAALSIALALALPACNNQSGFSGAVGNTPNGPRLASYEIVGTIGTPFTATVANSDSSWTFRGNVPLSVFICNNDVPAQVIATKTTSSTALLSLEIINANHVAELQSTSAPFGTVSVQAGGVLTSIAPPADPDLRIFVSGPNAQKYQALVEDSKTGFIISSRAPTLILFDNPDGKVDATFFGAQDFGTFTVNMTLGGIVVATVVDGPNATIRQP
jgi:hypothetical protein